MADDGNARQGALPGVLGRLAEARGTGEAAGGLVRVEVDGTGDIVDLVIESKAMRLASQDLAAAVRAAFRSARAATQQVLAETAPTPPDLGRMQAALNEIGFDAQRRLSELTAIAQDLSSRLDRLT